VLVLLLCDWVGLQWHAALLLVQMLLLLRVLRLVGARVACLR
jgi:hypothetical protein